MTIHHRETTDRPRTSSRKRWVRKTALLVAIVCLCACAENIANPRIPQRNSVVDTENGRLLGTLADGYRTFQGIPFAAPPVGELRWAPPEPATSWEGVRDATKPGDTCPQSAGPVGDPASDTEDCLYLNVTTPDHSPDEQLPVMFWIHGGGFYFGSGDVYQARRLATQGHVVVVSVNYRLGALGYLVYPPSDTGAGMSGNYGLLDQQAALRWVERNIERFGGNANNVTVFGESAGAVSTCALLASPAAAGLFQRAIVESGPCSESNQWPFADGYWFARPRATAQQQGRALAESLGCGAAKDVPACLRAVPAARVVAASDGGGYGPAYGGESTPLPIAPATAIADGRFNQVPVIHGTTHDEHSTFVWAVEFYTGHTYTAEDYHTLLNDFFGADSERVTAEYPLADYSSPSLALATVFTDYTWACTAITTDRDLARHVPTYAYEFADENPAWGKQMAEANFPTGAMHIAEVPYLLEDAQFPGPQSAQQNRLSDTMIGYWSRFARTGDPNGDQAPAWRKYRTQADVQSLAPDAIRPVDLGAEHRCAFWATIHH